MTVAFRAPPVFADTFKVTVPLPVPLAPDAIVIHSDDSVAVHAQPFAVVTETGPLVPPDAATDALVGLMVKLQAGGACAAACDTLKV